MTSPHPRIRAPWAALVAVSAGLFLAVLSTTMVSVALPTLGRALGVSPTGLEWTVDAYVLVYAALLIPGGVVGDRLGRKGVFLTGVGLFALGSLLCAVADRTALLLAGRVVQGIGPALLVPGSLTIIRAIFDDPLRRSVAIGVWSTGAGLAMAIGPTIGGLVVDGPGWRWVFGGNVPLAAIVAALAAICVPRLPRAAATGGFDLVGAAGSAASVGLLAFGAIEGQRRGWTSPLVIGAFVAGALLAAGFVWWEGRRPAPLINVSLFRRPAFTASNVAAAAVFFAFIGAIVYFSVYFQQVQGRSAVQAGLCIAPLGIAYALAATAAGRLVGVIGERAPLVGGLLLAGAATLALLRLRADTPFAAVWWNFAVLGVGVGLCGTPISTLAMSAVSVERAGMASAVTNAARQVGQVFGVAVLGALVYAGLPGGAETITPAGRGSFVTGLHHALLVAGIVLIGSALAIAPLLRTRSAVAPVAAR